MEISSLYSTISSKSRMPLTPCDVPKIPPPPANSRRGKRSLNKRTGSKKIDNRIRLEIISTNGNPSASSTISSENRMPLTPCDIPKIPPPPANSRRGKRSLNKNCDQIVQDVSRMQPYENYLALSLLPSSILPRPVSSSVCTTIPSSNVGSVIPVSCCWPTSLPPPVPPRSTSTIHAYFSTSANNAFNTTRRTPSPPPLPPRRSPAIYSKHSATENISQLGRSSSPFMTPRPPAKLLQNSTATRNIFNGSTYPSPPPPPHALSNKTVSNIKSSSSPSPPPPPPPPPCDMIQTKSTPIITDNRDSARSHNTAIDPRSELLKAIRNGTKLRHVEVNSSDVNGSRSQRNGGHLKSVSPEGTSTRSKKDLIDILRKALEERRPVIADSDDDDVESDNEAWN